MKKIILLLALTFLAAGFLHENVYAYTTISSRAALEMYQTNENLIVVDVREKATEYCFGHIPCAINLPLRSGIFEKEFYLLPKESPIMIVCHSGSRSAEASRILSRNGYQEVYSVAGGMSMWSGDTIRTCDEGEGCTRNYLYFPHIASSRGWETEIAVINISSENSLSGILKAYDDTGKQVGELKVVELDANGRYEIKIGETFSDPELIGYLIFSASSDQIYGYLKFYDSPDASYRVAIPAPTLANHKDIIISHIAVSDGWWTGLNLLNTTIENKILVITFNNGLKKRISLDANTHKALNLAEFIDDEQLIEINSAIISNAAGIVGLEIFGNGKQLSGILLQDKTVETLYYPHIASDEIWWTGIIAFNADTKSGTLTIKPYADDGTLLPTEDMESIKIGAKERFVKAVSELDLPANTGWLAIESTVSLTGFELFGTSDNLQLGGYTCVGIDGLSGVFPKLEKYGWSGIALVNTTSGKINVTLKAYQNSGQLVATRILPLSGFEKIVAEPETIFDNELDSATYITYKATAPVAAFQLNGAGEMLDALPGR
jgi:rhodanese-related sulfurtransferase